MTPYFSPNNVIAASQEPPSSLGLNPFSRSLVTKTRTPKSCQRSSRANKHTGCLFVPMLPGVVSASRGFSICPRQRFPSQLSRHSLPPSPPLQAINLQCGFPPITPGATTWRAAQGLRVKPHTLSEDLAHVILTTRQRWRLHHSIYLKHLSWAGLSISNDYHPITKPNPRPSMI